MKKIQLTQGKVALVDGDIFEELNKYKWHARKQGNTFYAGRRLSVIYGKERRIQMHSAIIGFPPKGLMTDHRDGNGLNNLRENLHFVTPRQNSQNKRNINKSSQFPGVGWAKREQRWRAKIQIGDKYKSLGYFKSEFQAFKAYQQAVEFFGESVIDISHNISYDTAIQQRSIS